MSGGKFRCPNPETVDLFRADSLGIGKVGSFTWRLWIPKAQAASVFSTALIPELGLPSIFHVKGGSLGYLYRPVFGFCSVEWVAASKAACLAMPRIGQVSLGFPCNQPAQKACLAGASQSDGD